MFSKLSIMIDYEQRIRGKEGRYSEYGVGRGESCMIESKVLRRVESEI